jgi:hypothetical protein
MFGRAGGEQHGKDEKDERVAHEGIGLGWVK